MFTIGQKALDFALRDFQWNVRECTYLNAFLKGIKILEKLL
jgi:hypothetical protein